MDSNLRDSGIKVIGNIPWGTHIAQLYDSPLECCKVVMPFIQQGLRNNEFCVWIYNKDENYEEIKSVIRKHFKDLNKYIDSGCLRLIPHTEWYFKDYKFQEIRVNKQWKELIKYALDCGFDGLRAVANTSWVSGRYSRSFSHYERKVNSIMSELPFIAICQYDANKVDTFEIAEILKNHSYVIVKNGIKLKVLKNVELMIRDRQLEVSKEQYLKSQKQLDEVREYDRIKTEFLANISHEFRTPLNVILSSLQMLKLNGSQVYRDKSKKYIDYIQQNCYRLLRLINNLIDLTKIDANFYEITPQNYNIIVLIKSITMSVEEYAKNKGIQVHFNADAEERIIACDPDKIERIILNLLSNAIKFTPNGGSIWVDISDCSDNVVITVRDTGIGIPADKQKTIFQRFQQVDKSLRKQHEGSGIGLSLVKALVEKHGGKISLKSEPGKGSEFIITLPCRVLSEEKNEKNRLYNDNKHNHVERINIEFSDIYF
ncbi:MAG: MEDS domain-containing protein [Bacillota bacterium]